jgi:hypothetical protein
MIKLLECDYKIGGVIDLTFSNGPKGEFDLNAYLKAHQGPVLEKLKDEAFAGRCFIDAGALCWPHGLGLSAKRLFELVHRKEAA